MSFEKPRGRQEVDDDQQNREDDQVHRTHVRSSTFTRIIALLIVIILGASTFTYYSIKRAGESGQPMPIGTHGPTPTATLIIPTPTQALFYETFLDNRNIWAVSNRDGFVREITNGRLVLTNINPLTTLIESLPNETTYSNFTLIITFAIQQSDSDDSVGIYVRGDSNLDHDYRIDINGDSTFDIAKEYLDKQSMPQELMLDGPKHISVLRPPGQFNTMIVTAQGPSMSVSINNALVASVTDGDYASGQIALFVRHGASSPAAMMSVSAIEIDHSSG